MKSNRRSRKSSDDSGKGAKRNFSSGRRGPGSAGGRSEGGFRARRGPGERSDESDRRRPGAGSFNKRRPSDDRPGGGTRGFGAKREGGFRARRGPGDDTVRRGPNAGSFNRRRSSEDRPEGGSRGPGAKRGYGDKDSRKSPANFGRPFKKKFGRSEGDERRPRSGSFTKGNSQGRSKPGAGREEGWRKPDDRKFTSKRPQRDESRNTDDKSEKKSRSFVESKLEKHRSVAEEKVETVAPAGDGLIRLNKFIANSGVCSRREADELIKMGLITVNGTAITEMGFKVKATDEVRHEGKRLSAEKPVYILMNKPKGFITTTDDPQERSTVMHIIGNSVKERVYPVGRLDRNTTGLLLITNDGEVADKLTHPSYEAKKIYKVELDRPITKNDLQAIQDGVPLEEGRAMVDDLAVVSDDKKTVGLEIHIGWNRVVRRIFEALNYTVVKLDRVVYAGLDKKDLKRGQWRFLTKEEIVRLKHFK